MLREKKVTSLLFLYVTYWKPGVNRVSKCGCYWLTDPPGRWAPGCPRQSCSLCRCVGTSRPGHRSRGRAAPVQPSGGAAGSGMRAPASRHTTQHERSFCFFFFFCSSDTSPPPPPPAPPHRRLVCCCDALRSEPGAPDWWTELFWKAEGWGRALIILWRNTKCLKEAREAILSVKMN